MTESLRKKHLNSFLRKEERHQEDLIEAERAAEEARRRAEEAQKQVESVVVQKQQAEARAAVLSDKVQATAKSSYRKGIFVSIGSLVGVVLIVAVIAIPNLLRARMSANEATAVNTIRTIFTAQVAYSSAYEKGFACTLRQLGPHPSGSPAQNPSPNQSIGQQVRRLPSGNPSGTETFADLIDSTLASGEQGGYKFEVQNCKPPTAQEPNGMFEVSAVPIQPGKTGNRSFCMDQTGVIKVKPANGTCAQGTPLQYAN